MPCGDGNTRRRRKQHLTRGPSMRIKNLGTMLLGIWLILTGLTHLVDFHFSGLGTIMAVLALVAGVLLVMGR